MNSRGKGESEEMEGTAVDKISRRFSEKGVEKWGRTWRRWSLLAFVLFCSKNSKLWFPYMRRICSLLRLAFQERQVPGVMAP